MHKHLGWRRQRRTGGEVLDGNQAAPSLIYGGGGDALHVYSASLAPFQQLWARHMLEAHRVEERGGAQGARAAGALSD